MNRGIALLALALVGCSLFDRTGDEAPSPPPVTTAPVVPPAPAALCPTIEQAILGTWAREGFVEEYRAGGVYVINGQQGSFRWLGPGRAFIDIGQLHAEYYLGLTGVDELVAVDPNQVGTVYRRTSPTPVIAHDCYDLRRQILGTWVGGTYTEVYNADGSYRVNDIAGRWSPAPDGLLRIETPRGAANYRWATLSPTSAIAFGESGRATVYTRQ